MKIIWRDWKRLAIPYLDFHWSTNKSAWFQHEILKLSCSLCSMLFACFISDAVYDKCIKLEVNDVLKPIDWPIEYGHHSEEHTDWIELVKRS